FLLLIQLPRPPLSTLFPYTTLFRSSVMLLCLLQLVKSCTQNLERFIFVLQLGLLILTGDYDTCRDMGQTYSRVCRIDTLSTVSGDRKSTRLNSSHVSISYAVFCLKK